jgi:voltage-gated potassium channel
MIRPEAVTFLDKMLKSPEEIYRVEDMIVSADSALCGKNLKTSGLLDEKGISIAAIRKGEKYIFNPPADEILDIGDALILIGETERIRAMRKVAG